MAQSDSGMYDSGMIFQQQGSVEVNGCGPGHHEPGWVWSTKGKLGRPAFSVLLIREGLCDVEDAQGKVHRAMAGDLLLMRWDAPRVERAAGMGGLIAPWCSFDWLQPELQERCLRLSPQIQRRHLRDLSFAQSCFQRGIDAHFLGRKSEASLYLSALLLEFAKGQHRVQARTDDWAQKIQQVCERIQNRPEQSWSLGDLAREQACDPDHFARMFRRITGEAPGRYVIRCRMERARFLLRHTEESISTLAETLGYCDPYAFSKQFKKQVGVSPSTFRESEVPATGSESGLG